MNLKKKRGGEKKGGRKGGRETNVQRGQYLLQLLFKMSRFGELMIPISLPDKILRHITETAKVKFNN